MSNEVTSSYYNEGKLISHTPICT